MTLFSEVATLTEGVGPPLSPPPGSMVIAPAMGTQFSLMSGVVSPPAGSPVSLDIDMDMDTPAVHQSVTAVFETNPPLGDTSPAKKEDKEKEETPGEDDAHEWSCKHSGSSEGPGTPIA